MDTTNGFPSGGIRVSDADRDQAIAELSEHFQAGRLTQEEYEERSGLRCRPGQGRPRRPVHRPAGAEHGSRPVDVGVRCSALAALAT